MGIRVVGVHNYAAEKDTPEGQWCLRMSGLERDCMKRMAKPDTEIVMRWPRWGIRDMDGYFFSLTNRLSERCVYHQVVAAEKEGYDAAIIICGSDPLLREIRTAVDIPVVGVAESALSLTYMLGAKFGALASSATAAFDVEAMIYSYGLSHKCVGVGPLEDSASGCSCDICTVGPAEGTASGWIGDTPNSAQTLERSIEKITKSGHELIKRGAELIWSG